jgi:hypothetical protein
MNPPSEHCTVELKIPNDPRALGALRGALEHTTRHLGVPQSEGEQLVASIEGIVRGGMAAIGPEQQILVRIQEHPSRIEIEILRPGGNGTEWARLKDLPGIDRVEQEISAGETRIKLVKHLPAENIAPHADH